MNGSSSQVVHPSAGLSEGGPSTSFTQVIDLTAPEPPRIIHPRTLPSESIEIVEINSDDDTPHWNDEEEEEEVQFVREIPATSMESSSGVSNNGSNNRIPIESLLFGYFDNQEPRTSQPTRRGTRRARSRRTPREQSELRRTLAMAMRSQPQRTPTPTPNSRHTVAESPVAATPHNVQDNQHRHHPYRHRRQRSPPHSDASNMRSFLRQYIHGIVQRRQRALGGLFTTGNTTFGSLWEPGLFLGGGLHYHHHDHPDFDPAFYEPFFNDDPRETEEMNQNKDDKPVIVRPGHTKSISTDVTIACPVCRKELGHQGKDSTKLWVVVGCGHVVCNDCVEELFITRTAIKTPSSASKGRRNSASTRSKGKGKARAMDDEQEHEAQEALAGSSTAATAVKDEAPVMFKISKRLTGSCPSCSRRIKRAQIQQLFL
ncbi:hypothetical protein BG011_008849 [Mortierella polycephala]|uniref:RING-type domain-containing protein n=1 Tax=Mortierella polycephala TaxID=41804 RepID=A0A9P6PM90_9FUNG|nr:hypothetical protein BG011_008849 [Mortierella polycephala]